MIKLSLMIMLMMFIMFLVYELIPTGPALLPLLLLAAAFLLAIGWLRYWLAHKDRHQAEPLVRFLRDAVTDPGRTLRRKSAAVIIREGLMLSVGGEQLTGAVDPDSIHNALVGVGPDSFVILESGPETYIQTASRDGGYVVEKRDGNSREHFRALRRKDNPVIAKRPNDIFDFEEAREIFLAYASSAQAPLFLTWERMLLPEWGE